MPTAAVVGAVGVGVFIDSKKRGSLPIYVLFTIPFARVGFGDVAYGQ